MKLVPLSDRIVLREFKAEEKTKGGIILTTAQQKKPQEAEVIAVGPGRVEEGKVVPMDVKVGDKVIYSSYAGTKVDLDEEEFIIVRADDILAVVE
ncbi:MAG: co-chaperone GroES [Clostridiales bacterium]|nr:co-chaperone GroES [Clostridiales bacterium]